MKLSFIVLYILLIGSFAYSDTELSSNLDRYQHFPASLAVEYQSLTPLSNYPSIMNIYQISGSIRVPFPFLPALQPTIEGGLLYFDSRDPVQPEKFDHSHIFGSAGLVYASRFTKNFEIGIDASLGFSQSYFPQLFEEYDTVGSQNIITQAGLRITIIPSFNLTLDIHPNIKYLNSLGPLNDYNGFLIGLGFAGQFRFGSDPDSINTIIRSILFEKVSFPPVFAAMQSFYTENPLTTITISNKESKAVNNVRVSFYQAGFMDAPTPCFQIEKIIPKQKIDINIYGYFNEAVFRTEGITPLTGEIIITYEYNGRVVEQKQSANYDLYDKTAVIWNDNRKAAAFVTPADSALRNYTSYIRKNCIDKESSGIKTELQLAMEVYYALEEIGIVYQADPVLPFTKVQENILMVDSINLPRETLKRLTGDCDDLSVLFCSLMESQGVESALITVPGHIFVAINTKVKAEFYKQIHPMAHMTIIRDGELWVPIEMTLIGKKDFRTAWRHAIEEYERYHSNPLERGFYIIKSAQEIYRPVGLREIDLGLQYGNQENVRSNFQKELSLIINDIIQFHEAQAARTQNIDDYNTLGINYAQFNQYTKAKQAFQKALDIDPQFLKAKINMTNLLYLYGDYHEAAKNYEKLLDVFEEQFRNSSALYYKVLINLSQAYYAINDLTTAKRYYNKAALVKDVQIHNYSYLISNIEENEALRSTEQIDYKSSILFAEYGDQ